jgi:fucose 4-O-acetylase-like acetyltransferase
MIPMKGTKPEAPASARMISAEAEAIPVAHSASRLAFIDNLRWVMIVLVVSMHAAVTYSHLGSWYFMEDPKPGLVMTGIFATYQVYLQAFFMGLLFLIAGYFVPGAFDRKGFKRFLRDRALRLGVPSLIFMLLIQPFTVFWLLPSGSRSRVPIVQACWHYLVRGQFLGGSGPMWFTVALLCFCLVYGIVRIRSGGTPKTGVEAPLPLDRHVIGLALLIGLCTFLVRIVQPLGASILNMQLCYFSQYILLFVVGIHAWRRNWLLRIPYSFGIRWFALSLALGSLVWAALLFIVLKTHAESKLSGGVTWQSGLFSFWESFFCVGTCLGLLVLFREKCNRQGPLTRWLSDNCFAVYLFHTPILIAITLGMRGLAEPKPVKFLMATVLGVTATCLASSLIFRRVPVLKRVL